MFTVFQAYLYCLWQSLFGCHSRIRVEWYIYKCVVMNSGSKMKGQMHEQMPATTNIHRNELGDGRLDRA